jgi:hypothetical protein
MLGRHRGRQDELHAPVVQHVDQPGEAPRLAEAMRTGMCGTSDSSTVWNWRGDLQIVVLRARAAAQRAEVEPHHAAGAAGADLARSMCSTGSSSRTSASSSNAGELHRASASGPSGVW